MYIHIHVYKYIERVLIVSHRSSMIDRPQGRDWTAETQIPNRRLNLKPGDEGWKNLRNHSFAAWLHVTKRNTPSFGGRQLHIQRPDNVK